MAMSSSSGFEQWVYGIDRFRRGRHGKTGMRRDLSVRSDGTVLTCCCLWRTASAPSAQFLPKILQRGSDAPIAAQGRAGPACRPDRRSPAGDAGSRWTAPPIFQSVSFRQAQRQITEAFPWNEAPRYLIRDRDGIYGVAVTRRLRAMGIRDKPIAAGSPWQNSFAERLIGTIRRECVDHIVMLGEPRLRRI